MAIRTIFASPVLAFVILVAGITSATANATPNTTLDVIKDCCAPGNLLDMDGPGDQGSVSYNQDGNGDLRMTVRLKKSGVANAEYAVFLVCGPGTGEAHSDSCGPC